MGARLFVDSCYCVTAGTATATALLEPGLQEGYASVVNALAFVIHGNASATLERCLSSLAGFDTVVCVDTGSTDGSFDISRGRASEVVRTTWQGFGSARALAMDVARKYRPRLVFFLDSDEYLLPSEAAKLSSLMPTLDGSRGFRVRRRNHDLSGRVPYVLYEDWRVRLFGPSVADWQPKQIVHEAFPRGSYKKIGVTIEHDFVVDRSVRINKQQLYGLLWAVQRVDERRSVSPVLARLVSFFRDAVFRGAMFRGGGDALRTSWMLSLYAREKYVMLARMSRGEFPELRRAAAAGDFGAVFEHARQLQLSQSASFAPSGRLQSGR